MCFLFGNCERVTRPLQYVSAIVRQDQRQRQPVFAFPRFRMLLFGVFDRWLRKITYYCSVLSYSRLYPVFPFSKANVGKKTLSTRTEGNVWS